MVDKTKQMDMLKKALAIEAKEKSYYESAAENAQNPLAKQVFERLVAAEDEHAKRFTTIQDQLQKSGEWPDAGESWQEHRLGAVLAGLASSSPTSVEPTRTELDALKEAMSREIEAYDMYKTSSKEAEIDPEKRFYDTLAGEEREHHLALLDAFEYLTDPEGWYTMKEKWTLEG